MALTRILRTVAILLALILSWLSRYMFDPDGVAYADVARALLRGDWHDGFNTYWSPLYSWLLAIGFGILHPPIAWETYIPHAIVFLGFLAALGCGEWLMREWECWQGPPAHRTFTTVAFYSLFMWAALRMTGMDFTSADIFLIAAWFSAGALLIRIRAGVGGNRDAALLGVTLAFGFFAKGGFLSAIPAFLTVLACMTGLRDRRPYVATAATFLVLLPYTVAISITHDRLVLTDAGWLNYSWLVTGASVEGYHQSDAEPPLDVPHHVRRVMDEPRVLSYQDHVVGTIPIHSDAAWWSEGYPVTFDFDKQWAIFVNQGCFAMSKAVRSPAVFFLSICLLAGGLRQTAGSFTRLWYLWLPALGALLSYSAIYVHDRYIAPPLALLGFAMIAAGWKSRLHPRVAPFVVAGFIALCIATLRYQLESPVYLWQEWKGLVQPREAASIQIAEYLHRISPFPGPRIGLIGSSIDVPWLELARGQIVAVVPGRLGNESWEPGRPLTLSFGEPDRFWSSDAKTQQRVFAAMRSAGAGWAVADSVPVWADVTGWEIAGPAFMFRPATMQKAWCYVRRLY